jgi:hypothetical protein
MAENRGMPMDPNERLQIGLPDWAAADRHAKQKELMELAAQLGLGMPARDPMRYAKGGPVAKKDDHPFNKSFDNKLLLKSRGQKGE